MSRRVVHPEPTTLSNVHSGPRRHPCSGQALYTVSTAARLVAAAANEPDPGGAPLRLTQPRALGHPRRCAPGTPATLPESLSTTLLISRETSEVWRSWRCRAGA